MLKARANLSDGRSLFIIGLSELNTQRLLAGQPIKFDLAEIGGVGEVLILGAKDEQALGETVATFLQGPPAGTG